jgi:hypothetical protein
VAASPPERSRRGNPSDREQNVSTEREREERAVDGRKKKERSGTLITDGNARNFNEK